MLLQSQQDHRFPLLRGKKCAGGPSAVSLADSPEPLPVDARGSVDAKRSLSHDDSPTAAPSHRSSRPHAPITESGPVPPSGFCPPRYRRSDANSVSLCCPVGQYTCAVSCGFTPRRIVARCPGEIIVGFLMKHGTRTLDTPCRRCCCALRAAWRSSPSVWAFTQWIGVEHADRCSARPPGFVISTNPKPFDVPVSRSVITAADTTGAGLREQ